MTRVAVTGIGIVAAPGRGIDSTLTALRELRPGFGPLRRFASPRNGHLPVAEVVDAAIAAPDTPRTLALAEPALCEATTMARLDPRVRTGLALGTCTAGMPETEAALATGTLDGAVLRRHECGYVTSELARRAALEGPLTTLSTACSSSAQAIATAADLLAAGAADAMIAGGADALCRLTLNGFASLLNVSGRGCRPFAVDRDGMTLGEGAAFLVLEPEKRARARGTRILAFLSGYGNTCDAWHPTAPHPDGQGARDCMEQALRMAALAPDDVDYLNAHGTGTRENDRAEARAIRALFGDRPPPLSSTKRVFGHTLGAAGAIEAVVAVLALLHGLLPGNGRDLEPDPECGVVPLTDTTHAPCRTVLSNSFGFGGNNSSLCFAAAGPGPGPGPGPAR